MNETPMVEMLKGCSLHSLLMLTSKALSRAGFGDVQILDRRQSKQRSRHGGHELVCRLNIGFVPMKVIVKVINDSVRVRMMDELAGAVIRNQADFGLIVTPHHVTTNAMRQQGASRLARVEVIDGPKFAALLSKFGIGLRGRTDIDYAFFGALEDVSARLLTFIANQRT